MTGRRKREYTYRQIEREREKYTEKRIDKTEGERESVRQRNTNERTCFFYLFFVCELDQKTILFCKVHYDYDD